MQPMINPPLSDSAQCVELGLRVCTALMSQEDWNYVLEKMIHNPEKWDLLERINRGP